MSNKYLITTDDGSSTLFLEEYDQAMHSISGAYEESLLKHIIPSRILDVNSNSISALDIGFGLGYNVLALIVEFISKKKDSYLEIVSVEKEKCFSDFLSLIKFNDSRDKIYNFVKTVYISGEGNFNNISLKIIFGDARATIRELSGKKFNAVFQDPFSPSKNPELWSVDYFLSIKNLISSDGILTTYSSADHIRRAMIEAGFNIGHGPSVGKKREGTIASINTIINQLEDFEIESIYSNIRSYPYYDPTLNLSRDTILQNRIDIIRHLKDKIK